MEDFKWIGPQSSPDNVPRLRFELIKTAEFFPRSGEAAQPRYEPLDIGSCVIKSEAQPKPRPAYISHDP